MPLSTKALWEIIPYPKFCLMLKVQIGSSFIYETVLVCSHTHLEAIQPVAVVEVINRLLLNTRCIVVYVYCSLFLVVMPRKNHEFEMVPVFIHTVVRCTAISPNGNEPHECPPVVGV